MAQGYYRELAAALQERGYAYKENAKGSHEKWIHEKTGRVMIVPRNLKSRHTANAILKAVGADVKF